jgi:hypothetical protein
VTEVNTSRFRIRFTMQRHDGSLEDHLKQHKLMPEAVDR